MKFGRWMGWMAVAVAVANPAAAFTGSKFNTNVKKHQPNVELRAEIKRCKQDHPGDAKAWAKCPEIARQRLKDRKEAEKQLLEKKK